MSSWDVYETSGAAMSSWDVYETSGAPALLSPSQLDVGHLLMSELSAYSIVDFIGEGCFGKVAKCQNVESKQTVAVKLLKHANISKTMKREISMLKEISVLKPVCTNIVQFFECFEYMGLTCLAFEMLDTDLYTFMESRQWMPMFLSEIRPIAQQLLVALDALKGLGLMHCDIKPDNVMFTSLEHQYLRVKLIDFGQTMRVSEAQPGMILQPYGYRAPEISLGLPFTEAIDIWGLGCVLAYLYLCDNLLPVNCEYQMLKCTVDLLGFPEDHLLRNGKYSQHYFTEVQSSEGSGWRLLSNQETQAAEAEDKKAFVDLLKEMLRLDGEQRVTPCQALQHPFVTMTHLSDPKLTGYLMLSEDLMSICPVADSSVTSPPADPLCVFSNATTSNQSDDPKGTVSIGGDSGVWSLQATNNSDSGDASSVWSCDQQVPPGCWDEQEPVYYSHGELSFGLTDETVPLLCDGEITKEAPVSSRFSFRGIRSFFRRALAVFCCCVCQHEED